MLKGAPTNEERRAKMSDDRNTRKMFLSYVNLSIDLFLSYLPFSNATELHECCQSFHQLDNEAQRFMPFHGHVSLFAPFPADFVFSSPVC